MASIRLLAEPTVHQVDVLLECIEREFEVRGARVRRDTRGEVRFRMPLPWAIHHAGLLRLVTAGGVRVSAGGGERRRLRYELHFPVLYALGAIATAALVAVQWRGPHLRLLAFALLIWAVVVVLRVVAARGVRTLLTTCARQIVERREERRAGSESEVASSE